MRTPASAIALIKQFESLRLTAYWDVNAWRIGYGSSLDVKPDMIITQPEAEVRLLQDIGEAENSVLELVQVPLEDNQVGALVSFVYNLGRGNLKRSSLLTKLNALDYCGAANEFERWDKEAGVPEIGILRRRKAERALFCTPDSKEKND